SFAGSGREFIFYLPLFVWRNGGDDRSRRCHRAATPSLPGAVLGCAVASPFDGRDARNAVGSRRAEPPPHHGGEEGAVVLKPWRIPRRSAGRTRTRRPPRPRRPR